MKKYVMILSAMFMAISFTACSQSKAPVAVKTAFSKKFPTVKKTNWDREGKTRWEAEFKLNGKEMSANFDLQGNWKETETDLKENTLPANVDSVLNSQFSGYKVKEVAFSETPERNAYEIVIKKGESKLEVTIDKAGKLLSKENAGEDND